MNYLIVDKNSIVNNCNKIKKKLNKQERHLFLMVKSNLYGFGYELLQYIYDYIDGIVVKDSTIMKKILVPNKKIIKLYDNKNIHGVLNCVMNYNNLNKKDSNVYIRVDPFLGMHGITYAQLKEINDLSSFDGVLIYINEYLSPQEIIILKKIVKIVNQNNLILNIGGSAFLEQTNYLNCRKTEVRLLREILFNKNKQSSMYLKCNVLNKIYLNNKKITIGFKSDRKIYNNGYLFLISIGYDDFKLLPQLYKNDLKLQIFNKDYDIACYPCMNTMWIYSSKNDLKSDSLFLFDNNENIKYICERLDIDLDEFYSSYSLEITRKYI